jgi:predicted  nucleic acid-binding Zn-ribbon protein
MKRRSHAGHGRRYDLGVRPDDRGSSMAQKDKTDVEKLTEQIDERRGLQAALEREAAVLRRRRVDLKREIDDLERQRIEARKAEAGAPNGEPVRVEAKPAVIETKAGRNG